MLFKLPFLQTFFVYKQKGKQQIQLECSTCWQIRRKKKMKKNQVPLATGKGSTNKRKKERVGSGESEREGARPA